MLLRLARQSLVQTRGLLTSLLLLSFPLLFFILLLLLFLLLYRTPLRDCSKEFGGRSYLRKTSVLNINKKPEEH